MPKVVILGSCRHEPYVILRMPNKLDSKLYESNHEKAFGEACKTFYPAIDEADEVWVYAPDGIGKHTSRDIDYAKSKGKIVRLLVNQRKLEEYLLNESIRKH